MRFLIQRVSSANVVIEDRKVGEIKDGLCVFVGISNSDTKEIADKMIHKLVNLRIFSDENGKTNLNLDSVNGELLIISQFTLYADCKHGNRPSFIEAGKPDPSKELYEYIINKCQELVKYLSVDGVWPIEKTIQSREYRGLICDGHSGYTNSDCS